MINYIIGGILVVLVLLALRTILLKKGKGCGGGCQGCSQASRCHQEE
ncbi:MAG: FeoB-associated Cys-rich membrane protein [Acidaminococcaceae bacterium]